MKKIILIDGMSLVFRAYHALSQANFKSPNGEPTGAVFGFTNILTNFIEKESPEFIAVAFDTREPTFRHIQFEQYKANRAPFPDDLVPQMPRIKTLIDLLGIPQIELAGFEADDIIGTIAHKLGKDDTFVFCMTSDKDYMQLVNDNVSILRPSMKSSNDFDIISYQGVLDKFGVTPDKIIDVLALIGDAVDNVPGVKGIGEKTAIPLIQQFGNLNNLYDNIDKIDKISVKNKLLQDKENAFMSKELVTLDLNVPIDFSDDFLARKKIQFNELDLFFKELGFTKIREHWHNKAIVLQNLIEDKTSVINDKTEIPVSNIIDFQILIDKKEVESFCNKISNEKEIVFEMIFNSYQRQNAVPIGLAIWTNNTGFSLIKFENEKNYRTQSFDLFSMHNSEAENKEIYNLKLFKDIFENYNISKISFDLKNQMFVLLNYGIKIKGQLFDVMIASYILNPDAKHDLETILQRYLNQDFEEFSDFHKSYQNKKESTNNLKFEHNNFFARYLLRRIKSSKDLYPVLLDKIKSNNQEELANKIEFPLIPILSNMEHYGVQIDTKALKTISQQINLRIEQLSQNIYAEAGTEFNLDSPKQLSEILFDKMHLPVIKKTKTGISTDISVLTELIGTSPIIENIIDYRQLTKLKSTYIDALPKLVNPETGKVHTSFNQTIASTGRLSSTEPNLQNIPIRTEQGKEIRSAFIASQPENLILSADYSQIELRIMAYYSQDDNLIKAFQEGLDIHSATASKLFDINMEQVSNDMRRIAKTVNFGIMYGLGAFGLSQRLRISRNEGQKIIQNYFKKYPGIKKYIDETLKSTQDKGYAETLMNRRRYFDDINSKNHNLRASAERAAINFPIQGTAADMFKIAMINIAKSFEKEHIKSAMFLQIHDEIVIDLFPEEDAEVRKILKQSMENALNLGNVPVKIEIGVGKNWLEAH
jgi:DNA polymerase-1